VTVRCTPLLLLVPLLVSACGGSSGKAAGTNAVAQFVKAGNQVCIRSDRRIYRLGRLSTNPVGWAKTAVAARLGVAEMRALKPPADRAATFRLMLRYASALAAQIQIVHDQLASKNYDGAASAQLAANKLLDHVHAQAKLAGLTFCQQGLTDWPA